MLVSGIPCLPARCLAVILICSVNLVVFVNGLSSKAVSSITKVNIRISVSAGNGQAVGLDVQKSTSKSIRESSRIPRRLLMTGKQATVEDLPDHVRPNVENTLQLNPDLEFQYMSDAECLEYIKLHADSDLAEIYAKEKIGAFRGDICRAVALWKEGGFYVDLDVEPRMPLRDLVDDSTTFMSVFMTNGNILNALIAVAPRSDVLARQLQEIRAWYVNGTGKDEGPYMGTVTLKRAINSTVLEHCPDTTLTSRQEGNDLQWSCGPHTLRLYREAKIGCVGRALSSEWCPPERISASSRFEGVDFGIFVPGPVYAEDLVAWSRSLGCSDWHCGEQ